VPDRRLDDDSDELERAIKLPCRSGGAGERRARMSRYRRKAMYWPMGLLMLAVGMCGGARNQSSSSNHFHAPERTLAQRSSLPVPTPQKPAIKVYGLTVKQCRRGSGGKIISAGKRR